MNEATIRVSRDLAGIARALDDLILAAAGERIPFTLLVFTAGRASYISSASREDSVRELRHMLSLWDAGMPDVKAHDYVG